jgi:hypothetical protein
MVIEREKILDFSPIGRAPQDTVESLSLEQKHAYPK